MRFLEIFVFSRIFIVVSSFAQDSDSPFFAAPIQNTTARLGDNARLACIVETLGHYQVAWFHQASGAVLTVGDKVLTSNERVSVTREQRNTWVLGISHVTKDDAGHYMCQVSTSPPKKLSGHLTVVEPPSFEWHSQIAKVKEGQSASLECHARGIPSPTIEWKREDNEYIRINSTHNAPFFRGGKLTLQEASPKTAGKYFCVASNGHPPSVSRVLGIKVVHAPIVELIADADVIWASRGDNVIISCRYAAYPLPTVTFHLENFQRIHNWSHNYFEIKPLHHQFPFTHLMTLSILRFSSFDFGNHSCVVRNEEGEAYDYVLIREKLTTTSASTRPTTEVTAPRYFETKARPTAIMKPELEGRGPRPLLDGSLTTPENISFPLATPPKVNEGRQHHGKDNISDFSKKLSKTVTRMNLDQTNNLAVTILFEDWRIVLFGILLNNLSSRPILFSRNGR